MGSTIDLHIHTNASDGTDSPEALLWNVQTAGINVFAITDHDTIKGALKMKRIIPSGAKIKFIQGVEFSCITDNGVKCHILGLNYDENNPAFKEALRTGDILRHEKFHLRIKLLHDKFGFTFTDDEIDSLMKSPGVGKPHIANMLVMKGLAASKEEAIERYIDQCKTGRTRIDASSAVKGILSAGGIPVWAHPMGGEGDEPSNEDTFRTTLRELMGYGIKGLECWYSKYKVQTCKFLASSAERSGLFVSGGSDYHGSNKAIQLGRLNAENVNVEQSELNILKKL